MAKTERKKISTTATASENADASTRPAKSLPPKATETATSPDHAVRCQACKKNKTIVTHPHNQALCQRCNMLLIRRHGPNYAEYIDNPAAMIQLIDERREERRDIKTVRAAFFQILNLMDQFDLSEQQRRYVFMGFVNVFEGLPEAQGFLTFHTPQDNVKNASREDDLRESANQEESAAQQTDDHQKDDI